MLNSDGERKNELSETISEDKLRKLWKRILVAISRKSLFDGFMSVRSVISGKSLM